MSDTEDRQYVIKKRKQYRKEFDKAPEGYRLLRVGTKLTDDDLMFFRGEWKPSSCEVVKCAWFARKISA